MSKSKITHINRMQSDFSKLRLPQPLMRSAEVVEQPVDNFTEINFGAVSLL
jgi:hypothetical protein